LQTVTDTFFSSENNLFERLFMFLDADDVLLCQQEAGIDPLSGK